MTNARRFAVFDIDGTLIRWQLYHAVVDKLAKENLIDKIIYDRIKTTRMAWKNRNSPDSFKDYQNEIIFGFDSTLDTISTHQFDEIAKRVITEYKNQVYTYTRNLIQQLKSQKYVILAISGSHHELVEMIADHYEFDDFIGSRYFRDDTSFSGDKEIASMDKSKALNDMIKKHNLTTKESYGVGDTESDIAMLKLVENPIAFNPDRHLFTAAKHSGWQIVIERKDVIYKLEPNEDLIYRLT